MAIEQSTWKPNWGVPPGEVLAEALDDRGMSQSELARRMDRPFKTINEIIHGKAAITPDTAIQLERAIGISSQLWNGLESLYRQHLAHIRAELELESVSDWAKDFPTSELVRHGLIPEQRTRSKTGKVAALLAYFGVSNPSAWSRQWLSPSAAFRESPAFSAAPKAIAAWLRWGEIQAAKIHTEPFSARDFHDALEEFRKLTRRDPLLVIEGMKERAAAAGVVIVLTPELRGTHLSGATRWTGPDRAIIQLSFRHKTDDQFWFTLFHESHHVLEGKKREYVDVPESDEIAKSISEQEADDFSRDILIPRIAFDAWVDRGDASEDAVRAFAAIQGISPGIVVGRLQRDRILQRNQLNYLKKSINWALPG